MLRPEDVNKSFAPANPTTLHPFDADAESTL